MTEETIVETSTPEGTVRGPYVQLSKVLRISRGPGRPELVSERPVKKNAKGEVIALLDDPEGAPTLVEFDEHCEVNVERMLRFGQIREYVPTSPQPSPEAGEGDGAAEAPKARSRRN